jgi:hypothetical protein
MNTVYTQAMKDNDILPVAGMNCLVMDTTLMNAEYEKCTILFIGIWKVVYTSESCIERISDKEDVNFKPLTPPIVLEDGKAYSFDSESVGDCGIYSNEDNLFHYVGNEAVRVEDCTNIKLLT